MPPMWKGLGCIVTKHFHDAKLLDGNSRCSKQELNLNTQVTGNLSDGPLDWNDQTLLSFCEFD